MAASTAFVGAPCLTGSLCLKASLNISSKKVVSPSRMVHSHAIRAAHLQTVPHSRDVESKFSQEDLEDTTWKVFTDETKGIVCYRTESGEIVCEGMDEGPHFYPPCGANFYMPDTRAAAILPLLGEGMYEI